MSIPTFVINLKKRTDRRENILQEFSGRNEFKMIIIEPREHPIARVSLWKTINHIIENLVTPDDDYFIVCEDDHQFTEKYRKELLFEHIDRGDQMQADVLSGGVSGLQYFVQVHHGLYWVSNFAGLQFTIIYRRFFQTILEVNFLDDDIADIKISRLSKRKFLIYPFISTQKEFGYSDVTPLNKTRGRVNSFFNRAADTITHINSVLGFYKKAKDENRVASGIDYDRIYIPTYIINHPEHTDRLVQITSEFAGRAEFDLKLIESASHKQKTGRTLVDYS